MRASHEENFVNKPLSSALPQLVRANCSDAFFIETLMDNFISVRSRRFHWVSTVRLPTIVCSVDDDDFDDARTVMIKL